MWAKMILRAEKDEKFVPRLDVAARERFFNSRDVAEQIRSAQMTFNAEQTRNKADLGKLAMANRVSAILDQQGYGGLPLAIAVSQGLGQVGLNVDQALRKNRQVRQSDHPRGSAVPEWVHRLLEWLRGRRLLPFCVQ
jgi:hypothetical protein